MQKKFQLISSILKLKIINCKKPSEANTLVSTQTMLKLLFLNTFIQLLHVKRKKKLTCIVRNNINLQKVLKQDYFIRHKSLKHTIIFKINYYDNKSGYYSFMSFQNIVTTKCNIFIQKVIAKHARLT